MARPSVNNGRRRRLPYTVVPSFLTPLSCVSIPGSQNIGDLIEVSFSRPVLMTRPAVPSDVVVLIDGSPDPLVSMSVAAGGTSGFLTVATGGGSDDSISVRFVENTGLLQQTVGGDVSSCPATGVFES